MSKVIVADTGPLIALALVDLLPALSALFTEVYVPQSVLSEAIKDPSKPGALAIEAALEDGYIIVRSVKMETMFQELVQVLDQGEAEALALASQLDAVVLIDEKRGRRVAMKRGMSITGSSAILLKAKVSGIIQEVRPLIEKLSDHGYRMSDRLVMEVLKRAGEL